MSKAKGQFEIVEIRASGAYGVVCAARRSDDPLGRVVGLKVLHGTLVNSPQVLMRTRDEARMLSRMHHPNIVAVEELLSFELRPVMVMEWVEGMSLRQVLDHLRDRVPLAVSLEVVRRTARALDDAYNGIASQGGRPLHIIHRDINPSNLLISVHGEVKVVDFGVSRGEFVDRETTTISTVLGAQGYMAPERMAGVPDGPAVDVYSLGVTFLECLTGRLPVLPRVGAGHDVALQELLDRIRVDALPGPVRPSLRDLLAAMCAFDPEDRPTAAEVVERLRAVQTVGNLSSDLSEFAASDVARLFHARPRVPPRQHASWDEVSFLEDPEVRPTTPVGAPPMSSEPGASDDAVERADRRLRRFLAQEGWPTERRGLKYLLALNPTWSAAPFLEILDRALAPWWQFWVRPPSSEELLVSLEMLRHRPLPEVQDKARQFVAHADEAIAKAAEAVVTHRDVDDEDLR